MELRQALRVVHCVKRVLQNAEFRDVVFALSNDVSFYSCTEKLCPSVLQEAESLGDSDVELVKELQDWWQSKGSDLKTALTTAEETVLSKVPGSPAAGVPRSLLKPARNISIYADGVFDLMHPGHFNAMRQAGLLGDRLVVGVCSDQDILEAKGLLPIYSAEERAELIKGCKWVDEVIVGTPYTVTKNFLDTTNCHYVAHGDDIAIGADGKDCYSEIREVGLLKTFRRTEGISTTNLLFRLLAIADDDVSPRLDSLDVSRPPVSNVPPSDQRSSTFEEPQWIVSTRRLYEFIGRLKPVPSDAKRVYVDGCFDVFNVGHLKMLELAKKEGSYLVVGIHDDEAIREKKGRNYPVMELFERAMNVLAMRVVDEVVVGAPWKITDFFLEANKIDIVMEGSSIDCYKNGQNLTEEERLSKFQAVIRRGILRKLPPPTLRVCDLVERVKQKKKEIMNHIPKRKEKEMLHYAHKVMSSSFQCEVSSGM